ncbi:MAG: relaxase domain-containing protein, partial [Candidatus Dormibacteraeota bacterium]|nr:relaxase domain-containing protein [Candidatus Dormibacteraeota bacterium]
MSICRAQKGSIGPGAMTAKDWWEYYTESHEHSQHTFERVPKNVGDYYIGRSGDAERPVVRLIGAGVAALGVGADHELTREDFEKLCDGRALDGKAAIHRGASGSHVPFVALAYSPHKSVSLLWAVADDDLREKVQAAHDAAVRAAIASLEAHTAPLRRRVRSTGKIVPERTAGLVVAEVRHHSARPVKPT